MPKVTLSTTSATNAGIAASGARTYLEFTIAPGCEQCRFSFGTTYSSDNSQVLFPGDIRVFEGPLAASAFSFSPSRNCVLDVSEVP